MITRDDQHIYRNGKKIFLSVTQHLVISGKIDFSMVRKEDLEFARLRGSHVHDAVRLFLNDDLDLSKPIDPSYCGYVRAFIKFHKEHSLNVWDSEGIIHSDKLITAGEFDFVGSISSDISAPAYLFEIKTSVTMSPTVPYQVAGYVKLWNECKDNKIFGGYGLHLKSNGQYRLHKYDLIKYGRKFETMVRANWDALSDGIIPTGARSNENVYSLCQKIIKGFEVTTHM